ncbi:relaxase/mobilization nuclease domain-containing protein [Aliivibrio fischeri]|nr:relaxase/mobilization nuclease domain-containing protein [Aliivibrio fischeri]MCE7575807.1 relaxase/mobilization nuclease domain-containing protein [Aliivibrio fischeri]
MIVKIHSRGTGCGSGPVDYLLGKDGQRDGATLNRGDPNTIIGLIDSSPYAKKYTSGVLSFAESDLPREAKDELMSSFESALLPGLDKDQFACLWVEHRDKGRLELNFVVPNIELLSGRRLQPYFDRVDRPRINAWQTLKNESYQLKDPNDPENKQALVTANSLPHSKKLAVEAITYGLLKQAENGEIRNRDDVKICLEKAGFSVVRETKNSLSIADPEGGKNLRLKGVIYEKDFRFGLGLRDEIQRASERYRALAQERVLEARETYHQSFEKQRERNQQRHQRPNIEPEKVNYSQLVVGDRVRDVGDFGVMGRDLVPRNIDCRQLGDNQSAERADQAAREQGRKSSVQPMWGSLMSSSSERDDRVDEKLRQTSDVYSRGVLRDDRVRDSTVERLRGIRERAREATSRLCDGLQRIGGNVRDYFVGERKVAPERELLNRASEELERSAPAVGKAIQHEQEISRDREIGDRGMSL